MRRRATRTLAAFCLTPLLVATARAQTPPAAPAASPPPASPPLAALAALAAQVAIPYQRFQLANGLTVLVHTDRKAPIIGVTTYYRAGSKNEPAGHTGFAHLYEHLFFGGSPNAPSFDEPLEAAGASNNGSTSYDRTNYVETVPKGALELALFLESDRMGQLLGAISQDKLDKQRGVVENEKRQGDNQPYGLVPYAINEGLLPVGHPYRHAVIGSMADLDAASLDDVRGWFVNHYAPGNAILVLAGDIDAETARPLVEKYFGAIAPGPQMAPLAAGPVTLPAPVRREMRDAVATTRLYRAWTGPGLNDPDAPALAIAMRILGGLSASRLDNALVRGRQLAASVSAEDEQNESLSFLTASIDILPGTPRAEAEAAFDAELARFVAEGPTPDELNRAVARTLSEVIGGMEQVGGFGGKGADLAEGLLYSGDPAHYHQELAAVAALTPQQVQAAAHRWLSRPALALAVSPGARGQGDTATLGGWGAPAPAAAPTPAIPAPRLVKRAMPPVAPVDQLVAPVQEQARLANGLPVLLVHRGAVPKAIIRLDFDAGIAADALDAPGTQAMMLAMLKEGTAAHDTTPARSATELLEAQERLGATIDTDTGMDSSTITLDTLTATLPQAVALLGDVVRSPAFAPADVERLRAQRLASLAQTRTDPEGEALHRVNALLFGPDHPYGQPGDGLGDEASLKALTAQKLAAAHQRWLRPDLARITVVGDVTMGQVLPLLNAAFGQWRAPAAAAPAKPVTAPAARSPARIVLVDRPDSPQSLILGARALPLYGREGSQEVIGVANRVLGGSFLSRLNADLREDKGWSYGVQTVVRQPVGPRSLLVLAPVETDRTGDALKAIIADMKAFPASRPTTPAEAQRATDGAIRALPAALETNAQLVEALATNQRLGRPADYLATLPEKLRAIDAHAIDTAAGAWLQPEDMVFIVVGDKAKIADQLKTAGLPVEIAAAP